MGGAFAIICDEKRRVLLCHRRDIDAWNLPGGRVEEGEAPWDAAIRETREEVGLEVEVTRLTGLYWRPERSELVFTFECRVLSGTPGLSDEADKVGYFALDGLPANTGLKHAERIRDALAGGPAVLRVQTGPGMRELFGGRT
ncbi:MAG: NUDIX domain-containing protein [Chloroflexi bacterium]|nr:MAG: NUDIX domain-containing protein [Chloroflexota bacterium]